jgi:dolichol kinase
MTFISLLAEALRYYAPSFNIFFTSAFGFLLRKHEVDSKRKNLTGATYVFISALICIIIFPKLIFITAFSILIISDIMAALIGRRYGKHKFLAKSLEGTLAFFVSAILVVFLTPKFLGLPEEYVIAIFSAAVGAIAENISFGFADDNLSVPLSVGLTMLGLYSLFLPQVKLFIF